jgi:hypothetical protein
MKNGCEKETQKEKGTRDPGPRCGRCHEGDRHDGTCLMGLQGAGLLTRCTTNFENFLNFSEFLEKQLCVTVQMNQCVTPHLCASPTTLPVIPSWSECKYKQITFDCDNSDIKTKNYFLLLIVFIISVVWMFAVCLRFWIRPMWIRNDNGPGYLNHRLKMEEKWGRCACSSWVMVDIHVVGWSTYTLLVVGIICSAFLLVGRAYLHSDTA